MHRLLRLFLAVAVIGSAYLLLWPVPADPAAWQPETAPEFTGDFARNSALATVKVHAKEIGRAPEDIAIDKAGRIHAGFEDGRIMRFQPNLSSPELLANTGGRPLGLEFDRAGKLIVCDSYKGLLSVSMDGSIEVLSTECEGRSFGFTDDLAIGRDGIIYFTDASWKFGQKQYIEDLIEHRPNGRLLAYDPATKTTRVLLDALYFANGVAIAPDDSYLLITETGKYRVWRYWLQGPKAGLGEIVIKNLPGFPDGITAGSGGRYWLAIASPRDALLDAMLPHPWLRRVVLRLPSFLRPAVQQYGFVLAINGEGKVVENLQDPDGNYAPITNVREHEGKLFFGSIEAHGIGSFMLSDSPQ